MLLQTAQALFKRRLTSAIALPIVLLLLLSGVSIWQLTRLLSAMQWVDHTDQVIAGATRVQKLLLDMETGVRGYLLSDEGDFLEPYEQGSSQIHAAFDKLEHLVSDNPSQAQRVVELRSRQAEWNRYTPQEIALKQRGKIEPVSVLRMRKQLMDTMRSQIAAFIATEEQLRDQRTLAVRQTTRLVILTSIGLAVAIGSILAYFIRRQLLKVSQSYEQALLATQEQTENAQRAAQRLASLHEIDRAILAAESVKVLVRAALSRLRQSINCQQATLVLFNLETGTARLIAGSADGELQPSEGTTAPIGDFALAEILQQKQPRYIQDIAVLEQCPPVLERLLAAGMHSCISIPLIVKDDLIGELSLAATERAAFNAEAQAIAREVAAQLAIAIQQSQLREQLQGYAAELEQRVADRTAQLQEINGELESFSYSISHDLRAPLRTIQGFAQAFQEDYGDQLDSIGKEYIQSIVEDTIQMDSLIADLLAYSHLSRTQIDLQPTALAYVVEEALRQLGTQLQERLAEVTVEPPLPQVMAQRSILIQVVTNLLSNAIKFVEPGVQPKVRVQAEEIVVGAGLEDNPVGKQTTFSQNRPSSGDVDVKSPVPQSWAHASPRQPVHNSFPQYSPNPQIWVRLLVIDNGIGIAPEHQDRIFRVFERLHGIETYPGTGIGLAIVRKGLERMGGRVGVESHPGQGSCFWIALPKAVLNHEQASDEPRTSHSSS